MAAKKETCRPLLKGSPRPGARPMFARSNCQSVNTSTTPTPRRAKNRQTKPCQLPRKGHWETRRATKDPWVILGDTLARAVFRDGVGMRNVIKCKGTGRIVVVLTHYWAMKNSKRFTHCAGTIAYASAHPLFYKSGPEYGVYSLHLVISILARKQVADQLPKPE